MSADTSARELMVLRLFKVVRLLKLGKSILAQVLTDLPHILTNPPAHCPALPISAE